MENNDGFIVYNTRKGWSSGHTHLNNYSASKNLIRYAINKRIPSGKSNYYLESLKRISRDSSFIAMIDNEIAKKKNKKN